MSIYIKQRYRLNLRNFPNLRTKLSMYTSEYCNGLTAGNEVRLKKVKENTFYQPDALQQNVVMSRLIRHKRPYFIFFKLSCYLELNKRFKKQSGHNIQ